ASVFSQPQPIVPHNISQPQQKPYNLVLNNNLYILNTQNYIWVNTFDASNIYETNSYIGIGCTEINGIADSNGKCYFFEAQDGLILIYGGMSLSNTQAQPDVATLN
ncbi:9031_t:CDS:2, partial [Gigaspora margarita]